MRLICLFPRFFYELSNERLKVPVSKEELKEVLHGVKWDKSPGPDDWMVEFYLGFFDLLANDLLSAIEESRILGRISGALNATFLALIPKKSKPSKFGDFRPIKLYNLLYKLKAKITANRMKSILSLCVFKEQFGYLFNKQILDAIGAAQNTLHSVKSKKIPMVVMKLDLAKAYDKVDWTFLRLVLQQVGLNLEVVNWIMGCVTSTNFAMLINGSPSQFFKASCGLR